MNERPVIDLLLDGILNGDENIFEMVAETRAMECIDIRALLCTTASNAIDLDLGLGLQHCEYVTPIFEGPRAWFMSRHTAVQSRLEDGRSTVLLDYSLGFDSNFADKVKALINGKDIGLADRDRVTKVLKLKASNSRVQFDVVPFLCENIRFDRDDPDNKRPLETLIAFYMLDHLDWSAFLADSTQFRFDTDIDELRSRLRPKAENFLSGLHSSPTVLAQEARAMGTQALLLRFAALWHTHKGDRKLVLRDLLDFSIFELGALPISELTLIWRGTLEKQVMPFFGPLINPSTKILKCSRGMAWDLTHLRSLQDTAKQSVYGSFFIPYFVSLDERWRDLIRLNPIKIMLIDDATCAINLSRTMEVEFQLLVGRVMTDRAKAEMTPIKIQERRLAARSLDYQAMKTLLDREEQKWR